MYSSLPDHLKPKFPPFAGSIDPAFLYADKMTGSQVLRDKRAFKALGEAERNRLVRASKSPTDTFETVESKKKRFLAKGWPALSAHAEMKETGLIDPPIFQEFEPKRQVTPLNSHACKTVIEFREFQETWRIRTEVEATTGQEPPSQSGPRESLNLSGRAATKIAESCEYMAIAKGGYKTFATGTFTSEVRKQIENGETTIQKEVSRTMDAMQKLYRRGFLDDSGERVEAHEGELLPYCWVVEIPKNKEGGDNPHVHLLMGWKVEYKHFQEWASRIESIWGNGTFKLEKIRDSNCAGAYMAKAAGYMSKAQDQDDQGKVIGNRYGISSVARAPAWVKISEGQLHNMGQLIVDIYDHLSVEYKPKFDARKKLNWQLENTPKSAKKTRLQIGAKLAKVREEIKAIPIRCNKYQLVVKGKAKMLRLMSWFKNEEDFGEKWLPEKAPGMVWIEGRKPEPRDNQYFHNLYKTIGLRKLMRRLKVPKWMIQTDHEWHQAKGIYEEIKENLQANDCSGATWFEYSNLEFCQ